MSGRDLERRRAAAARDRGAALDAPITIVEPDPGWAGCSAAEQRRLAPFLPGSVIHHVGSTAVPGLAAKPVVDLMAHVTDLDAAVSALVARAGYAFPAAFNATLVGRRWLCRPSASHRTHHLHLVDDARILDEYLRFRDRLRATPRLRDAYAALKRDLAAQTDDREVYSDAKSDFVAGVLDDGPARLVVGVGASRSCPDDELASLVDDALASVGHDAGHVRRVATATVKRDEAAVLALAAALGVRLDLHEATALAAVDVPSPSATVARAVGTPSVAEASALLSAGPGGRLLTRKRRSAAATCAIARSARA